MRIYSIAENSLLNDSNQNTLNTFQSLSKSQGPVKKRTAHMTSNEMNQIGLF
jgi:hypothetical protein